MTSKLTETLFYCSRGNYVLGFLFFTGMIAGSSSKIDICLQFEFNYPAFVKSMSKAKWNCQCGKYMYADYLGSMGFNNNTILWQILWHDWLF